MDNQLPFPLGSLSAMPAIKLYRDNGADLFLFRQQHVGENSLLHGMAKQKLLSYRLIFASFGAFFILLAFLLWNHSLAWPCGLFYGACDFARHFLGSISVVFGASALMMSAVWRTDQDVAANLLYKAKRQLKQHYVFKRSELGLFGKSRLLKVAYREALDHVERLRVENLHLMVKIYKAAALKSKERENLYDQALCELEEKLFQLVQQFKL